MYLDHEDSVAGPNVAHQRPGGSGAERRCCSVPCMGGLCVLPNSNSAAIRLGTQQSQAIAGYASSNSLPATIAAGKYMRSVTAANVRLKLRTIQARCLATSPARMAR